VLLCFIKPYRWAVCSTRGQKFTLIALINPHVAMELICSLNDSPESIITPRSRHEVQLVKILLCSKNWGKATAIIVYCQLKLPRRSPSGNIIVTFTVKKSALIVLLLDVDDFKRPRIWLFDPRISRGLPLCNSISTRPNLAPFSLCTDQVPSAG